MPLPSIGAGARNHLVTFENPSEPIPDGDGGHTFTWTPLTPKTLFVRIAPATARELERVMSGSVASNASHIVIGPWHPGVTTKTRITFNGRVLNVTGIANVEERSIEMVLTCNEVVA